MSGSREFVRGQAHFFNSQTVATLRKKKLKRAYFMIPFMFLFVVTCAAFIGFLYYLDVRLNAEIRNYNDKINTAMKRYSDDINAKIIQCENEIKRLNYEIEDLKDKNKSSQNTETTKFKGVTVEHVEEFPEIEDVEERDLQDMIGSHNTSNKHIIKHVNITGSLHKELASKQNASATEKSDVGSNEDVMSDDTDTEDDRDDEDDSGEDVKLDDRKVEKMVEKRLKRSAELVNSGGINAVESTEEFIIRNRSHHAESKVSSQNQTPDKRASSCSPCEEPSKGSVLQKITNRRSSQPKKMQNSAIELEDSIDITETRKTVVAAHFGADSSKYSVQTHSHYEGNNHLKHPTGEYEDWRPSSWFDELNMDKHFALVNGNIKVHASGLYFVYAQIFYSDLSDVNGYAIYINSKIVLQCITSTFTLRNVTTKSNTCFTGGVIKCNAGDKISVKTMDENRKVMLEPSRSFVGMFKIGDFQTIK